MPNWRSMVVFGSCAFKLKSTNHLFRNKRVASPRLSNILSLPPRMKITDFGPGWDRHECSDSYVLQMLMFVTEHGRSLHTFIASTFGHMATARAEKKEIQCTMPQNVGLPSPGISKLLQCLLNYSG
ncbi:hypothetical protein AVEN_51621-1 [Araneus ventricosus]|uniref:Uncharacterized protein n=1 Tax=Araneus ventricosus TaxID=182803 RepID=A0A4Y2EMM9_ARAVE|nr:hypothetical protein AVEN_51621-1 [Araneus ventricosus]